MIQKKISAAPIRSTAEQPKLARRLAHRLRAGDQVGAWSYALMGWMGLTLAGIAFTAVPLSVFWLMIAVWLWRKQEVLASENLRDQTAPPAVPV